MVADWSQMDSMNTEADNGDLFGVDLFSDELLEIYNSSDGANDTSEHHVSLSTGKRSLVRFKVSIESVNRNIVC